MPTQPINRFRTWQLWNGLACPPINNPVYEHAVREPFPTPPVLKKSARFTRPLWEFAAPFVRVVLALGAPLTLPIVTNVIGAVLAYSVSAAIYRERERGTYDLLALTPSGAWTAVWAICFAVMDRLSVHRHVDFLRAMAILGLILLAFPMLAAQPAPITVLIGIAIALQVDSIQSIVVGCLCGMLGHTYSRRRVDAGMIGVALFAFAQLLPGYLAGFGLYRLLSDIATAFAVEGWVAETIVVMFALMGFFLAREFCIRVMWHELQRRLQ